MDRRLFKLAESQQAYPDEFGPSAFGLFSERALPAREVEKEHDKEMGEIVMHTAPNSILFVKR